MLPDTLHAGAVLASAAATAILLVGARRGQAIAVPAALLMTVAMADGASGRWIGTVWWVSAQILLALVIAAATRIAAGTRRGRGSSTTLHETVGLLLMAAIGAGMPAGAGEAATHHGAAGGLTATVIVVFALYAGVTVRHLRARRGLRHRLPALLMVTAATMMLAAGWSG